MSIHPRIAITEGMVNLDDALSTEVGSVIRQRANGSIQQLVLPFRRQASLSSIAIYGSAKRGSQAFSKASAGLDAQALQSTTASAVAATVSAAQQHIELIARIFAETGMKRLYKIVLHLITTKTGLVWSG